MHGARPSRTVAKCPEIALACMHANADVQALDPPRPATWNRRRNRLIAD